MIEKEIINYLESKISIIKDYLEDSTDKEYNKKVLKNVLYTMSIGISNYLKEL